MRDELLGPLWGALDELGSAITVLRHKRHSLRETEVERVDIAPGIGWPARMGGTNPGVVDYRRMWVGAKQVAVGRWFLASNIVEQCETTADPEATLLEAISSIRGITKQLEAVLALHVIEKL